MEDEEEVLFSLNAVFKIGSVIFNSTLKVWMVELTATDAGSEMVEEYLISITEQLDEYAPLICFGRILLFELVQVDQAEKYFEMLLKSMTSESADIATVYNNIGHVHRQRHELELALNYFELAYEIRQKRLPPDHPHIAASIYNIAGIYRCKGESDRGLNYYRQVLVIDEKNYSDDHENKAATIKNIGRVYTDKGDFDNAYLHLIRALDIFKHVLPANHPQIARCLGYIGYVHGEKDEFDCALDCYHQQLDIEKQCWPPDHPGRLANLSALVNIYLKMNKTEKALGGCGCGFDLTFISHILSPTLSHSKYAKIRKIQ